MSLSGQTYRRVPLRDDVSLLIRASGFANLYGKSRFNDIAADLAIGPEINLKRDRIQLELGATQRWFGQKPFLRSARAAATLSHQIGGRTMLRLSGSASRIDNQQNHRQDGRGFSGQIGLEHGLTRTTTIAGPAPKSAQPARSRARVRAPVAGAVEAAAGPGRSPWLRSPSHPGRSGSPAAGEAAAEAVVAGAGEPLRCRDCSAC